ncbi:aminotransferase class III-fold pyridoxal phosphate-dependent enzyme [Priestia megaterium]|uniref:aminotransferase class III-fold pyridoxal phosphate-dependent enzyme n=1 Tax=Priestia megaterium TaxID=1404 RepID=UPI00159C2AD0|nr:aminotransferase class III-fold pyridoxal phosphate-dependent enzyme [Priestia megaterium]
MVNSPYAVPMGTITKKTGYDISVKKATDCYLWDENEKKYLDLRSGLWNVSLGYNQELYKSALSMFDHYLSQGTPFLDINSYNHDIYHDYSTSILNFINNKKEQYKKIFYTNSGSEGTELATKLIKHLKSKDKHIVTYDQSYHGTFFAGLSASGIDHKITVDYAPRLEGFVTIKTPKTSVDELAVLKYIEDNHQYISAFLFEPIIGSGGVLVFNKEFIQRLYTTLKRYNILLVFDEVATGFFRTGNRFFFEELEVSPDVLILSKSINNGILPFGLVAISHDIYELLEKKQTYIEHFSTQNGNILGIASAKCTLDYMIRNEEVITHNVKEIENVIKEVGLQFNITTQGIGAMFSIPVNNSNKTMSIIDSLKDFGILCYYYMNGEEDNGITLFPPLLIDVKLLKKAMKIIARRVLS